MSEPIKKLRGELDEVVKDELSLKIGKYPHSLDVMIDIETMDTRKTALITQIAAIVFTTRDHDFFQCEIEMFHVDIDVFDIHGEICAGNYTTSEQTVSWWKGPKNEIAFEKYKQSQNKQTIKQALESLSDFLKGYRIKNYWANSPRFDMDILENSYQTEDLPIPWNPNGYRKMRDVRTLFEEEDLVPPYVMREDRYNLRREAAMRKLKNINLLTIEHDPRFDCVMQIYDIFSYRSKVSNNVTLKKDQPLTLKISLN